MSRLPDAGEITSAGRCCPRIGGDFAEQPLTFLPGARMVALTGVLGIAACATPPDRLDTPKVIVGLEITPYGAYEECVELQAAGGFQPLPVPGRGSAGVQRPFSRRQRGDRTDIGRKHAGRIREPPPIAIRPTA